MRLGGWGEAKPLNTTPACRRSRASPGCYASKRLQGLQDPSRTGAETPEPTARSTAIAMVIGSAAYDL